MKHSYSSLISGEVVLILVALVTYIHTQLNLILDMLLTCPNFSIRWIIKRTVAKRLLKK